MKRLLLVIEYARKLAWLFEVLVSPWYASETLLAHPKVAAWLEKQTPEDREKIRAAAPLVIGAILASVE
jgi:hypothetical protein